MTHSFRVRYYHSIWSTKNRQTFTSSNLQTPIYAYFGGIIKHYDGALLVA